MQSKKLIITALATASVATAAVGCDVATGNGQPASASKEPVAQTVPAKTLVVKAKSALQPLTVRQDGTVRITLPGNPSTGYDWQVAQGAAGYLKQVGEPTFKAESSLDGAPGMLTYTFKALKAGDTVLVMKYSQPWEKDQPAAETAAIAVHVVAKGDSPNVSVRLEKATASITLKKGQSLDIALPANPSTGYSWTLVGQNGDVLAANGRPRTRPRATSWAHPASPPSTSRQRRPARRHWCSGTRAPAPTPPLTPPTRSA